MVEDSARLLDFEVRFSKSPLVFAILECFSHSEIVKEEHLSFVAEPNSQYVGHVSPSSGSGYGETTVILKYIVSQLNGGFKEVEVLYCEETNKNAAWKGRILRKLKQLAEKRMQWVVWLLHFNDFPFRAFFTHMESTISNPHSYTGPIVLKPNDCKKLPVVSFKPYHSAEELRKLTEDLIYLFRIFQPIKSGAYPEGLSSINSWQNEECSQIDQCK